MLSKNQRDASLNKLMLVLTVNKLFLTRRRMVTSIKKLILLSLTSQKNWIKLNLMHSSQLMEQLNLANLRFSTTELAEALDTFNMKTKIAHKPQSKLLTTLNKDQTNKLSKSTFNKLKIPEKQPMLPNSQTCLLATYQKTLLLNN